MRSRALLVQGGCLLVVLVLFAIAPAGALAATQTRADASDARDGAFGRADLRSVTWDIGPTAAVLAVSIDASTFGGQRADVAIDVLLDTDADGIADRDIAATRNADGVRIDVSLRALDQTLSTADCQDLTGKAAGAQATVETMLANGLETFLFAFDPQLVPGGLSAFRWAVFAQAPPDRAAAGPWDVLPDAANPDPSAANPADRRCGAALGGVRVRVLDGVTFPDPVVPPPQPPAPPQLPASPTVPASTGPPAAPPPNAAVLASFGASPKIVRVSRTGSFVFSFATASLGSGQISLQSTKRVRIGATRQYVRLAGAFVASSTGSVSVKFQMSRGYVRLLRRVKQLPFVVTVALAGKTFTTTLTLRAPRRV